jgi:hypothetical protein
MTPKSYTGVAQLVQSRDETGSETINFEFETISVDVYTTD